MSIKSQIFIAVFSFYCCPIFTMMDELICCKDINQIIKALDGGMPIDSQSQVNHNTLLIQACHDGRQDIVQCLIDRCADVNKKNFFGQNSLAVAALYGYASIVQLLLNAGADVNTKDIYDTTPLHAAVTRGIPQNTDAHTHFSQIDTIILLLNAGAQVNAQNNISRSTALRTAVFKDNIRVIKILLAYGADMTLQDEDDYSPLARAQRWNATEVIKLFHTHIKRKMHYALSKAIRSKKLDQILALPKLKPIDALRKKINEGRCPNGTTGTDALILACYEGAHDIIQALLKNKVSPNPKEDKEHPLLIAAQKDDTLMVTMLLDAGAKADVQDQYNLTPLHYTAYKGNTITAKLLLNAGAIMNAPDDRDATPLHIAIEYGNQDTALFLLSHYADITKKDENGKTPLTLAKEQKMDAVISYIELQQSLDKRKVHFKIE